MGFFDRLRTVLAGQNKKPERTESEDAGSIDPRESSILLNPEHLEGMVDVDQRANIIEEHYETVSSGDARFIAETLKTQMEGYDLRKYEAKKKVRKETELDRELVEKIWWTERQSIQALDTVSNDLPADVDMKYSWSTAGDDDVHPVCEAIASEINSRGSGVSASELVLIIREKAEMYSDEGGTPERAEHLVPHHKCRSAIVSQVG